MIYALVFKLFVAENFALKKLLKLLNLIFALSSISLFSMIDRLILVTCSIQVKVVLVRYLFQFCLHRLSERSVVHFKIGI